MLDRQALARIYPGLDEQADSGLGEAAPTSAQPA
jgi:hypothetical protein